MYKEQVLITGGSKGIGLGLAKCFLNAGCRVLITGRDLKKLEQAAIAIPGLEIYQNDISEPVEREALAIHIRKVMPGITYLINNAGMQRRIPLVEDNAPWAERQMEIDTLLSGPIHLNHLLIPVLLKAGKHSTLINVTSGGAYVPQVFAPVYSACKAALHHYTLILRHALSQTSCRVVELIPPAVRTELAGPGQSHGATIEDFCKSIFADLKQPGKLDIGYAQTTDLKTQLSGRLVEELMKASAARFPVATYMDCDE
ncbi:SDR family NAD(P)-dependent oxidoreductase [Pedobacter sp. UYP1]|uniref:SDR family NAD(P)-dependent oxidoreductase n=1 Tax=Pedobacter sp. UYP1 TaxID=1756396 RepID=UPI003396D5D4